MPFLILTCMLNMKIFLWKFLMEMYHYQDTILIINMFIIEIFQFYFKYFKYFLEKYSFLLPNVQIFPVSTSCCYRRRSWSRSTSIFSKFDHRWLEMIKNHYKWLKIIRNGYNGYDGEIALWMLSNKFRTRVVPPPISIAGR